MSSQRHTPRLRTLLCALFLGLCTVLQADVPEATITSPSAAITVARGQVVPFAATSTDSVGYDTYTVTSITWNFGDGTTGAGAATTHAYATDGVRTVTLTVAYRGVLVVAPYPRPKTVVINKTATATRTVTVLAPPSIGSFSASATSVGVGKSVTLSWSTANATSLSVAGVGSVSGSSVVVYPPATTTYTLTAANAVGSASASVTVTAYAVGVSLNPGSATLKLGEGRTFTAAVVPATQGVSWSAPGGALTSATGTSAVFTGTQAGTFVLRATSLESPAQSATATVTVLPVSLATPVPTPADARALVGGTVAFTATVSNAVNTRVSWSVNGGGSINSSGVFTATQLGTWTVTATSQADPSRTAWAAVQVVPLVVTVSPSSASVHSGQVQAFSAGVTGPGSPSQAVSWWVDGVAGGNATLGTITSAGIYTAPSTPGAHTIQARSVLDGTQGTATVQLATWTLRWKKDIVYLGTKEVAEIDQDGVHVTLVDHLGSPRYEVRADHSIIEQKFAPFGESLTDPTTAWKFAKGFTNHEQTDPSGLIYMQARFYAPWYGRFLSPDPARDQHFEETQSWNIYSYVRNNPITHLDPTGESDVQVRAYLRSMARAAQSKREFDAAKPKVEDLSKGDLRKIRTTQEGGGVKEVRTVTEGHGTEGAGAKGSFFAGKKTEVETTQNVVGSLLTATVSTKVSPAELEVKGGANGASLEASAADRGPNASVGFKLTLGIFGGIDLLNVQAGATTGSQLGVNGGFSPQNGLSGGASAALGAGVSFNIGALGNLFKVGGGAATQEASKKVELKKKDE